MKKKKMVGPSRLGLNKTDLKSRRSTSTATTTRAKRVTKVRGFCVVEEMLNYLKSDSFLYTHLISFPPPPSEVTPLVPPQEKQVPLKKVSQEILYTSISMNKIRETPNVVAAVNGYNLRRP